METAAIYQEILEKEFRAANKRLVVILLLRPADTRMLPVMNDFGYLHHNSGKACYIYAVGFSNDNRRASETAYAKSLRVNNTDWYYSDQAFFELKSHLEYILDWEYTGNFMALILQNNPGKEESLNFNGCASVDLEYAIRREGIGFYYCFMEELMRNARRILHKDHHYLSQNIGNVNVAKITKNAFYTSVKKDANKLFNQCVSFVSKWH